LAAQPPNLPALRRALTRWYRANHRVLPWRAAPGERADPYHVLVSEAMLQQTQVATVIDYFNRFVERFPTVETLASAEEQAVLRLWQGLGYYRRARHLHATAKRIVSDFGGQVPGTVEQLLQLPGVGRYTAGAVASIAFDRPAPIVDGNVSRVVSRLMRVEEAVDSPTGQRMIWDWAERLLPGRGVGDFNQAMMELGAVVCTPRNPGCLTCPVRRHCRAAEAGVAESLPIKAGKAKQKRVTHQVIAIERRGKWLFEQRGSDGLWAGMWQMPTHEAEGDAIAAIAERTGLALGDAVEVERFSHQTTHRKITFVVSRCEAAGGRLRRGGGVWRRLDAVDDLPLAKPQLRVVGMLNQDGGNAGGG